MIYGNRINIYDEPPAVPPKTAVQRKVDTAEVKPQENVNDADAPIDRFVSEGASVKEPNNEEPIKTEITAADDGGEDDYPNPENNKITVRKSVAVGGLPEFLASDASRFVNASLYNDPNPQLLFGVNALDPGNDVTIEIPKNTKPLSVEGDAIFEATRHSYESAISKSSCNLNSAKGQTTIVYNNKKKNFDALFFASGATTKEKVNITSSEDGGFETSSTTTRSTFNVYGAVQKEFKNKKSGSTAGGDILGINGYYSSDETMYTKIGGTGIKYNLGKWLTSISADFKWTKIADAETVHTSNIHINFLEPKIEETQQEQQENTDENNTVAEQQETKPNNKKWNKYFTPCIDINDEIGTKTRLGVNYTAVKNDNMENIKFGSYAGVSTTKTSSDEQQTYEGNLGAKIEYAKPLGTNTMFETKAAIYNQFRFLFKDIITTGMLKANLDSPKISAYADARYTKVPDNTYTAVVAGIIGKIKEHWEPFAEVYWAKIKDNFGNYDVRSAQIGLRYNF